MTTAVKPRSDVDRMLEMFSALNLGQSDSMAMVTVPGAPWSKSRPRFTKTGRSYAKPEDRDAEERTASYLKRVVKEPYPGNVGMACLFFRPNRQRIDADNLLKHVCDAGNGILWHDDSQCTAIMGVVELDADRPRTVVAIGEHVSTLKRGSDDTVDCRTCGKPIPLSSRMRGHAPKTCSQKCRQASLGYPELAELVPCQECGRKFRRRVRTQKLCSETCRTDSIRNKAKRRWVPYSLCMDCGKELAHRRGGRCRDCWKSDVAARKTASVR